MTTDDMGTRPPSSGARPLDGQHVLLVEDEALIAFEAEDLLLELGAGEVTVCSTYAQANSAVEQVEPGLGVFDLNLSGRHATPLVERFLQRGGRAIVATGYELEADVARLDVIHLMKPYDKARMAQALRAASG